MGIWKLRLSMAGTLALIIGISTLFFTVILTLTAGSFNLLTLGILVGVFNIVMWLISPYMIDAMYRVRAMSATEDRKSVV